jgi:toxin secretion/phage lysis holin
MIQHTPSHIESAYYYLQELFCAWQLKGVIASVATFLGTEEVLFLWLVGMMTADLVFGLWEAFKRRKFSCRMLGRGIMKYPCYCLYIFLVGAVDASFTVSTGYNLPLLELFISYLVATDAVSVMGHMIRCGLPVPRRLRKIILHAQTRVDRAIDKIDHNDDEEMAEEMRPRKRSKEK